MRHPHHRAIAGVFAVHGAVGGSLATRMPWIQDHLGLDPGVLGLALLCPSLGAFVAMPMAGRLAHRFGGRAATRTLLALWGIALALPALAPGLPWLCAALLVYGAAAGACDVVMNAQGVVVERRLGRSIMSSLHGLWSVGNFAGAGAGAAMAAVAVDARAHLALMAAVLLLAGLAVTRGLPDLRPGPGEQAPPRFAVPSRAILAIGLVGLCATVTELSGAQWAAVYTVEVTGAGEGLGAVTYAIFAAFMVVTRLCGDAIVRRLGPVTAVRGGAVLATAGAVVVATAQVPVAAIAGFALVGVGVAVTVPLVFAAAGNAGPTPGQGVAGVATITYLSGLAAPAVTGWVAGATSFPVAFGLLACVTAVMGGCAGVLRPRRARTWAGAGLGTQTGAGEVGQSRQPS
ncbi:MFS transporter [Nonomuraea sp. SBT364]|uniref:MFS transporter n=1 Tax=Nonomuraea sp. SBT364 TaxID=1580530 RepID=UPI00066C77B9|nr:MFS transporter [Nonomuraea sp. SBT364]